MSTIVADIKEISAALYPDSKYSLQSNFHSNVETANLTSSQFPIIVLNNELPQNCEIKQNANIMREHTIVLYFLEQDTPDNTDEQTNTIQQVTNLMASKFALNIFRLPNIIVEDEQSFKLTPEFHIFNTDLSGTKLEMKVEENTVVSCN